jgi:hypothetical protein
MRRVRAPLIRDLLIKLPLGMVGFRPIHQRKNVVWLGAPFCTLASGGHVAVARASIKSRRPEVID